MRIIIYFLLFMFLIWPLGRFLATHLVIIVPGAVRDLYYYIKFKKYNECNAYGRIICYTGLFGQGKTKECVRFITSQYQRYNGLPVYDTDTKRFVKQRVVVYSNVELTIPYVPLTSLQQLVDCQSSPVGTVNLFLIDEASVVFNSREFKNNFSLPALNTILTSRHHRIGLYLTSQRFGHMDALLRQVTSYVYECRFFKPLRIQKVSVFDAWDCENCTNLLLLKPLSVHYFYSSDAVYANYNTYAMVEAISKQCEEHAFVDDAEILTKQGTAVSDARFVTRRSRRLRRRMR